MSLGNMSIGVIHIEEVDQVNTIDELYLDVFSENSWMRNEVAMTPDDLRALGQMLIKHSYESQQPQEIEVGIQAWMVRTQPSHPVRVVLLPADYHGHMTLLITMKVADNPNADELCQMCIEAELGALERFGKRLMNIAERKRLARCSMYELSEWEESCMEHAEHRCR